MSTVLELYTPAEQKDLLRFPPLFSHNFDLVEKPTSPWANESQSQTHVQTAERLLQCVRSVDPMNNNGWGPWNVDKVYEQGKSGNDWIALKSVDPQNNAEYVAEIDGKLYFDLIVSSGSTAGQHQVIEGRNGPGPLPPKFEKGSPEYNKVVNFIDGINFPKICPGE